jgi:outer membrane protein
MKYMKTLLALCLIFASSCFAADKAAKVRVVNFKTVVEKSKVGKQEQDSFEALKKQMETVMQEKEKTLNDLMAKLDDTNYLDSISAEAEGELKRKFRGLSQEMQMQQQQYMQTLQQANFAIVQKLNEMVSKATQEVSKRDKIDLVVNDEGTFFFDKDLDISDQVVTEMDKGFEPEKKK